MGPVLVPYYCIGIIVSHILESYRIGNGLYWISGCWQCDKTNLKSPLPIRIPLLVVPVLHIACNLMGSVNATATTHRKNLALFPGSRCLAIVAVFRNVGLLRVAAGKGGSP